MTVALSTPSLFEIASIKSKLSPEENDLRFKVMHTIIDTQLPYTPENLEEEQKLLTLRQKNILDNEKQVYAIYPVSARETNKKVTFAGSKKIAFAMCAIDALGMYYTFGDTITIDSECQYSQEKIKIVVKNGQLTILEGGDSIRVLYKNLNTSCTWSCCCCTCIHFFKDIASLEAFVDANGSNQDYYNLSLQEAFTLSRKLFSEE